MKLRACLSLSYSKTGVGLRLHVLTLILLALAVNSFAQEKPTAEVSFSYQFQHLTASADGTSGSTNLSRGWNADANVPILQWLGIVADFSGVYDSQSAVLNVGGSSVSSSASATIYTYGGGPQLTYRRHSIQPFARFVVGNARLAGSAVVSSAFGSASGSASVGAFFLAPGGGADFRITHNVWLHGGADYFRTQKYGVTLSAVRAFAGVTFIFSRSHEGKEARQSETPQPVAPRKSGLQIAVLDITAMVGRNVGAEIADVKPEGLAARAGLRQGDVINQVDGKPINNPAELASALSTVAIGEKVRIGFLVRGQWQTETTVVIGQSH